MSDTRPPTLIVGDFHSRCGVCGVGADPTELTHTTVLPGFGWPFKTRRGGCGAQWTHVQADADSRIGAGERIREMRPDLTLLPEMSS